MFASHTSPIFVALPPKILTLDEIREVVRYLKIKAEEVNHPGALGKAYVSWRVNLMVFRLSTCCGLRSVEIRHLRRSDLTLGGSRPYIRIRKEATKTRAHGTGRPRLVPLWWDSGTLEDIREWAEILDARPEDDPLVVFSTRPDAIAGRPIPRRKMYDRWKTCLRCLHPDRVRQLSIHCGRHSFCSHSLRAGRSLLEVRDAAGHAATTITEVYLHSLDTGILPDMFPEDDE